jgi:protein-L-isoaspartate(D-aspartate) O-methyltransferase
MKIQLGFFILVLVMMSCKKMETKNSLTQTEQYQESRNAMVEIQIRNRGISDENVLNAMRKVPRHQFVPTSLQQQAYRDEPLPIGENQTISQPYIVAYMSEQLDLKKDHRVLEIGTGSGYQAAILAELCDSVFTIEIIPTLSQKAQTTLMKLGYKNIFLKIGDGYLGWKEKAPFDAIIVTAAPDHVPQPLLDQLKLGGRLVIPVGNYTQYIVLIQKTKDGINKQKKLPVRFVPMTGKAEEK